MNMKEKLESIGCKTDCVARRRSNTSGKTANVTAETIEKGLSIEELRKIGVPVYAYQTQVTIHGRLPGFRNERVCGYKSLTLNQNGSLGVRYVAIDGEKKAFLKDALRTVGGKWFAYLNSQGFELARICESGQDAREVFRSFPRELIYGSVTAAQLMDGRFAVFAAVGAIEAVNLDPLLRYLTGHGEDDCKAMIARKEAEYRAEAARRNAEYEAAAEKRRQDLAELRARISKLLPAYGQPVRKAQPGFLKFASGITETGELSFRVYEFAKRGPCLCYRARADAPFRKYAGTFETHFADGRVFAG